MPVTNKPQKPVNLFKGKLDHISMIIISKFVICFQGHESFASHESLEQLHRLVFVLGITHVIYSFIAIALAMIKVWHIYLFNYLL